MSGNKKLIPLRINLRPVVCSSANNIPNNAVVLRASSSRVVSRPALPPQSSIRIDCPQQPKKQTSSPLGASVGVPPKKIARKGSLFVEEDVKPMRRFICQSCPFRNEFPNEEVYLRHMDIAHLFNPTVLHVQGITVPSSLKQGQAPEAQSPVPNRHDPTPPIVIDCDSDGPSLVKEKPIPDLIIGKTVPAPSPAQPARSEPPRNVGPYLTAASLKTLSSLVLVEPAINPPLVAPALPAEQNSVMISDDSLPAAIEAPEPSAPPEESRLQADPLPRDFCIESTVEEVSLPLEAMWPELREEPSPVTDPVQALHGKSHPKNLRELSHLSTDQGISTPASIDLLVQPAEAEPTGKKLNQKTRSSAKIAANPSANQPAIEEGAGTSSTGTEQQKVEITRKLVAFRCIVKRCRYSYDTGYELLMHVTRRHSETGFICSTCFTMFSNASKLAKHVAANHENVMVDFSANVPETEIEKFPIKCSKCFVRFADFATLRSHVAAGHTKMSALPEQQTIKKVDKNRPFHCLVCCFPFSSLKDLWLHIVKHPEFRENRDQYWLQVGAENLTGNKRYRRCYACKLTFVSPFGFLRHLNVAHKVLLSKTSFKSRKAFSWRNILQKCQRCSHRFRSKFGLFLHVITKHYLHLFQKRTKEMVQCRFCLVWFLRIPQVWKHVKKVHSSQIGKRPKQRLKCDHCNRDFFRKASFKFHVKMHKESNSPELKKTTTKKKSMILPQPLPQCFLCGHSFMRRTHLWDHLRRHKEFVTQSGETRKHYLETHQLACRNCYKLFSDRLTLLRHLRDGHPALVFGCVVCGKHYSCREYLMNHRKKCVGKGKISKKLTRKFCDQHRKATSKRTKKSKPKTKEPPVRHEAETSKRTKKSKPKTKEPPVRHEADIQPPPRPLSTKSNEPSTSSSSGVHFCQDCGQAFRDAISLRYHSYTHTGLKEHKKAAHCSDIDSSAACKLEPLESSGTEPIDVDKFVLSPALKEEPKIIGPSSAFKIFVRPRFP